jgi:putative hydrolase of HD superfamily
MKPSINSFGALAGLVKKVKRTGWLRYLPENQVESVGDHSAKIAFLALYLRNVENVDYVKCMQMALIHDIAEGIVGDFTPYCKITYFHTDVVLKRKHRSRKQQ